MHLPRRPLLILITFLVLTFFLTYLFYSLQLFFSNIVLFNQPLMVVLASYGPAFGAIITTLIFHEDLREFGWNLGNGRFYILAIVFPLIIYPVYYGILWIAGYLQADPGYLSINLPLYMSASFLAIFIVALGEEIGWRGFLVPHVKAWTGSFLITCLFTGLIWAVWHYPFLISRSRGGGVPLWFVYLDFTVGVVGIAFVYCWLRLASGSFWPCVLFHAVSDWVGSFLIPTVLKQVPIITPSAGYLGVELIIDIIFPVAIAYGIYHYRNCITGFPGCKI